MANDKNLRMNGSGCVDLTAYSAITTVDDENYRFHKLLHTIFDICELSGFKLDGRITLVDLSNGKVHK